MKKIFNILLLSCILFMFVTNKSLAEDSNKSNANVGHTVAEVGRQIANWSIAFYNEHKSQCTYDSSYGEPREISYSMPIDDTSTYCFDCVGWVSFAIHHATGLGGKSFTYFASPQSGVYKESGFESVWTGHAYNTDSSWSTGDILIISDKDAPHVGIYIGNNEVIDMTSTDGLRRVSVNKFAHKAITEVGRVTQKAANTANFEFVEDGALLPSDETYEFEFNGLPSNVSYSSPKGFAWLFDQIFQFFGFFAGLIINILKLSILGYAIIAQNIVNAFIDSSSKDLSGTATSQIINDISYAYVQVIEDSSFGLFNVKEQEYTVAPIKALSSMEGVPLADGKQYTIEDIVYNHIPLIDVNVFTSTPGGQQLPKDSIVEKLRQMVATWYVSFRNLAVIALVIIIIYLGIRIALSTIPEKTGQYKTALFSWVVSIILIFIIHYFMLAVISVNESVVRLLQGAANNELSIYETIRTRAVDVRMNIGIPATIMYIVLVIYFYKFLWIYMKRYFTIMILIIIAPFICAKYAFDGAKGKRGTSLTSWMYDFGMNVFLQSVHALLYTTLMSVAIELAVSSIWGFIIGLVFINFILKADKIFLEIFNFGRAANIEDVDKQFSKADIAGAMFVYGFSRKALGFGVNTGRKAVAVTGVTGRKLYDVGLKAIYQEDANQQRNKIANGINRLLDSKDDAVNKVYRFFNDGEDSKNVQLRKLARKNGIIGRDARRIIKARRDLTKKRYMASLKRNTTLPISITSMALGIPAFVVSPKTGYAMISKGFKQYRSLSKPKSDTPGYKGKFRGSRKLLQMATLGGYGVLKNREKEKEKEEKKQTEIGKAINYIKQVDTYYEDAKEKWHEITRDMTEQEKTKLAKDVKTITVENNKEVLNASMFNYMNVNEEHEVTRENIANIIEDTLENTGLNQEFTAEQIDKIKENITNAHNYNERNYINQINNVVEAVHKEVIKTKFSDGKTRDFVNVIDSIEEINIKAEKEIKRTITNTDRLISDIRTDY